MTDETRTCPQCQQPVPHGARDCPTCKTPISRDTLWPVWHGAPGSVGDATQKWDSPLEPLAEDEFEALALDPTLTDAIVARPGKRSLVIAFVACGIAWFLVTRLYDDGTPAPAWDYVWFGLAAATWALGIWLLVALIRRAREHGLGPALHWLWS